MGKLTRPIRFSTSFVIDPKLLNSRGAFDPVLNADTPLFIDPLLLAKSRQPEMRSASHAWHDHFRVVLKMVAASRAQDDLAWRQAIKMLCTPEFKGTCLGYGAGSIQGRGIGKLAAGNIANTAKQIVDLGIGDPEFFALLPLLEDGVGPDLISDQATQIIAPYLAEFTIRVISDIQIATQTFSIDSANFRLPANPYVVDPRGAVPVVLTPTDVLADLPIAQGPQDIDTVSSHNRNLRHRINRRIGRSWAKADLRRAVLSKKSAFEEFLRRNSDTKPYDLDSDANGRIRWLEVGLAAARQEPLLLHLITHDAAGLVEVVRKILEHFKKLIEDKGIWKSLYAPNGVTLPEPYAQKLFFVLADAYCKASNIDITPEANAGPGPVDFKFSSGYQSRVVVEIKLSTNGRLQHGYTKQLEKYKRAEDTENGIFLVIDVGGSGKQVARILKLEELASETGLRRSMIFIVDGNKQDSASKG